MALIVEDGTLVDNANSYVNLAEARTYASTRGVVPVASEIDLEANLIKAMDFIESHRDKFKGGLVDETQALQFPRSNMIIDDFLFDYQSIPQSLKDLQSQLAIEIQNGVDLFPTVSEPFVTEETVGPIRTRYTGRYGTGNTPKLPYVNVFLSVLLRSNEALTVTRI